MAEPPGELGTPLLSASHVGASVPPLPSSWCRRVVVVDEQHDRGQPRLAGTSCGGSSPGFQVLFPRYPAASHGPIRHERRRRRCLWGPPTGLTSVEPWTVV